MKWWRMQVFISETKFCFFTLDWSDLWTIFVLQPVKYFLGQNVNLFSLVWPLKYVFGQNFYLFSLDWYEHWKCVFFQLGVGLVQPVNMFWVVIMFIQLGLVQPLKNVFFLVQNICLFSYAWSYIIKNMLCLVLHFQRWINEHCNTHFLLKNESLSFLNILFIYLNSDFVSG